MSRVFRASPEPRSYLGPGLNYKSRSLLISPDVVLVFSPGHGLYDSQKYWDPSFSLVGVLVRLIVTHTRVIDSPFVSIFKPKVFGLFFFTIMVGPGNYFLQDYSFFYDYRAQSVSKGGRDIFITTVILNNC